MPDDSLGELEELTAGETQLVYRCRSGETQEEAARRLGVSRGTYSSMERDLAPCRRARVRALRHHERCLLYRRRAGRTQQEVATDLKLCRYWLNKMEQGLADCSDLLCYWEQ